MKPDLFWIFINEYKKQYNEDGAAMVHNRHCEVGSVFKDTLIKIVNKSEKSVVYKKILKGITVLRFKSTFRYSLENSSKVVIFLFSGLVKVASQIDIFKESSILLIREPFVPVRTFCFLFHHEIGDFTLLKIVK